jgi:hypothetical protein
MLKEKVGHLDLFTVKAYISHPLQSLSSADNIMCGQRWQGPDPALELLLQLDGEEFQLRGGYRSVIEARRIEPVAEVPHGIRYNLTLLDRYNQRVLGFDNAHRVRTGKRRYGVWSETWDHKHIRGEVKTYRFVSVIKLMDDFWMAVEEHVIKTVKAIK